jgi:hypothetical protein
VAQRRPGAWRRAERRALRFLDLPPMPDPALPPATLARYAGTYVRAGVRRGEAPPSRCKVRLRHGALFIDGVPHVWPNTRLLATDDAQGNASERSFALESLPFAVAFDPAGESPDLRLRISGPELLWGAVDATYLRQPEPPEPPELPARRPPERLERLRLADDYR